MCRPRRIRAFSRKRCLPGRHVLPPGEVERYGLFAETAETHTLYEHCRRALERGSTSGAHGLPLMGSGDWNDGMNRVGAGGQGESVWMGWFLHTALTRFAALAKTPRAPR